MAETQKTWAKGDRCWRGYARTYQEGGEWFPDIRPCTVRAVHPNGGIEVWMYGVMPGAETKRNPGCWIAVNMEPSALFTCPKEALRRAIAVARDANVEAATTHGDSDSGDAA